MHGAIVADTLRVPWIPVRTNPKILPFKWLDWCQSVKLPYRYEVIKGAKQFSLKEYLYPIPPYLRGQSSFSNLFDSWIMSSYFVKNHIDFLAKQLERITLKNPYLSCESHLESLVVKLEERLNALREDITKGLLI